MNPLYVSIGVAGFALIFLIAACLKYWMDIKVEAAYAAAVRHLQNSHIAAENSKLNSVLQPLSYSAGGLSKRMSESIEIAQTIQQHAPQLFKQHPSLAYTLHANDQFFQQVYESVSNDLGSDARAHIEALRKEEDIFQRIYADAGIVPPAGARKKNIKAA